MSVKKTLGRVVKSTNMPDLTKNFSPEQLADAITAKRTGMKLTLVDVSEALSLSKPTLIKIEKGDINVKLVNILKVMEYLGLSFSIISDELIKNKSTIGVSDDDWY
ncbi:helix-turn-helix domain-containing protein [Pseudocolwellia agarivorans]|uniref:helix-turn-helix domain-containing protein n=1 Tax=Pseudocolwellia agarivorans TaxID=1911682 RepID=UPI000985E430|nr:helix-turn-helix domain-containing protein [Pseudocolwellia agarivorans]